MATKSGVLVYLPLESGEWRTDTGRAASISVIGIDVDIDVSARAGIWC